MNSGFIPEEDVNEVRKQSDIVEVVSRHVHLTKQGRNYMGLCPFHSEKTPSFTVSQEKQIFRCFGCQASGDVIRFVMDIDALSFPEAVTQLAEEAGMNVHWSVRPEQDTPEQRNKLKLREANEWSVKFYQLVLTGTEQGKPAKQYMNERGITDRLIQTFELGYAPPFWDKLVQVLDSKGFELEQLDAGGLVRKTDRGYIDLFRDRIMFPIHDGKGQVIAFAGRVLTSEQQPKYMNTPETILFNKSRVLYNLHRAKTEIRRTSQVVLFEGYMDVMKAWEADVKNGVATMGTALTQEHAAMMKRYADEVLICYDGDEAGQNAAAKSIAILEQARLRVKVAVLPNQMDPDDYIARYGPEAFRQQIIEVPLTSTQFKLKWVRKRWNRRDPDSKIKFIRSSLQIISKLSTPSERELYLKELSQESEIEIGTLKQEIEQMRQEIQKKQRIGDNIQKPWNTVMNDRNRTVSPLKPAYYNAERTLLYMMMHHRDVTLEVQAKLGDQFHVEVHAALAAYLYAFFAQHEEVDLTRFVSSLRSDELVQTASSILLMESEPEVSPEIIDEYIRHIRIVPQLREIEQKKREMLQAEKNGDVATAIRLGSEIIALERQLKGK
ncbi:DNA primase [Marinicrinis sediminis]|uniref:DNA primase n=1 Tax=Marinicrinis sediminis TaxID=1652465 RepID=A0ABW5RC98_9BACL